MKGLDRTVQDAPVYAPLSDMRDMFNTRRRTGFDGHNAKEGILGWSAAAYNPPKYLGP